MKETNTEPERVSMSISNMSVDSRTEDIFLEWKNLTGATKAVIFQKMLLFCHCSDDFDVRTAHKEWKDIG